MKYKFDWEIFRCYSGFPQPNFFRHPHVLTTLFIVNIMSDIH